MYQHTNVRPKCYFFTKSVWHNSGLLTCFRISVHAKTVANILISETGLKLALLVFQNTIYASI